MTEDTSASKELLSHLPTNIIIKSSSSVKVSTGESVNLSNAESSSSVHASNAKPLSSVNATTVKSLISVNASTQVSFSSINPSPAERLRSFKASSPESIQLPKPRTLSIANLPAGISVSSVSCDSTEIMSHSNDFVSTMDKSVGEAAIEEDKLKKIREESLSSISPSFAESTRSPKPRTLSINNLPPGISVSSVSCDSIKPTKIQSDDLLSAMDKFVEEEAKEEGKMLKMREDIYGDQVLDRRISNEDDVIAKADISFLASQVLKDVNHKLNMIANISVSLASETTSTAKRKRFSDSDDFSISKDEDNIEDANGKRKRNGNFNDLPIIKDGETIEIANSEISTC